MMPKTTKKYAVKVFTIVDFSKYDTIQSFNLS